MTRSEIIAQLEAEYAERRRRNENEAEDRRIEAEQKIPGLAQLRAETAGLLTRAARRIMQHPEQRVEIAREFEASGKENSRKMHEMLEANGYPSDYTDIRYTCPNCRDTGYLGERTMRFCPCFEKTLMQRLFSDAGLDPTGRERFETFDDAYASDTPLEGRKYSQRWLENRIRTCCETYANAFPETEKPNIILTGGGGLGKTFLMNAIAARLIERGFAPLHVTAQQLGDAMRRHHFRSAGEEDDREFTMFIDAPILLIDDLGTEPMMKNITVEYLYTIIDARWRMRRHTVIATNLDPVQLKDRYFERIASRLFDKNMTDVYRLEGRDLRRR